MALTITKTASGRFDGFSQLGYWAGRVTFDASYATGGEAMSKEDLGFTTLYHVSITPDFLTSTTALVPVWDQSAEKIMLFEQELEATAVTLVEIDSADDVSALVLDVFGLGLN